MGIRSVVLALIAGLFVAGCATKNYVRTQLGERDVQLSRMETTLGDEHARVEQISGQLGIVRSRADDANRLAEQAAGLGSQALRRADDAGTRAGQALTKADETDGRFTRAWAGRNKRNVVETIEVRFGFNKASLDDRAQTALHDALKVLKEDPNVFVALEGYTDSTGPADYNLQLSQRRAESVRRFMVQNGVELHRIQSIGLGQVPTAKASRKHDQDRRVTVHLMAAVD